MLKIYVWDYLSKTSVTFQGVAGPAGFICFQEPLMLDQQLTRTNCTDVMTSANRFVAPDSENVDRSGIGLCIALQPVHR
jgi:hypothetical protein